MSSLDSGFHQSTSQIPGSALRKSSWILDALKRLDSGFRHPDFGFQTNGLDSKANNNMDFGLPYMGRCMHTRGGILNALLHLCTPLNI